jgi:AraC family transcriptional regulator of adaptative response/methylated-DNA-[protein]-cysteine methyltransferase
LPGQHRYLDQVERELREYFAGTRRTFETPVALTGSDFQSRVWNALLAIPSGETCSYAALAKRIGRPQAVRAVGRANGENRLSIIVPCHRVIGADGAMVGFGGGLERKTWLLRHEGALLI